MTEFGFRGQDVPGYHNYGMGGETKVQQVDVKNWRLGNYNTPSIPLITLPPNAIGKGVYGLLGMDFLSEFNVELDVADGLVNLFQRGSCSDKGDYWSDTYSTVSFDRSSYGNQQMIASTSIDDHNLEALIDTGASISLLSWHAASVMGLSPDSPGMIQHDTIHGLDGKSLPSYTYRFKSFIIADEQIAHPAFRIVSFSEAHAHRTESRIDQDIFTQDMVLGADFVKAHRLFIDNDNRKIYFNYLGGPVFAPIGKPVIIAATAKDKPPTESATATTARLSVPKS